MRVRHGSRTSNGSDGVDEVRFLPLRRSWASSRGVTIARARPRRSSPSAPPTSRPVGRGAMPARCWDPIRATALGPLCSHLPMLSRPMSSVALFRRPSPPRPGSSRAGSILSGATVAWGFPRRLAQCCRGRVGGVPRDALLPNPGRRESFVDWPARWTTRGGHDNSPQSLQAAERARPEELGRGRKLPASLSENRRPGAAVHLSALPKSLACDTPPRGVRD